MAGSLNRATLIGNLGKDPEVRRTQNGDAIVSFNLAMTDSWRDKATGARRDRTEWVTVVIFNEGIGKVAEQYLKKGSKVYVEGSLQTRKWTDKDGNDRYTTEVVLQKFGGSLVLLDSRKDGDAQEPRQDRQGSQQGGKPFAPSNDLDDLIPFNLEWR